jgi:hypothetical protein
MFRLQKLTLARSLNGCDEDGAMASRSVFLLIFIKGLSGPELSLTCRQGDFVEDLAEEGMRTKASGTG